MMAEFFDITKDSQTIFQDTAIMRTEYADQMNSYPVIYLTFADAKNDVFNVVNSIKNRLIDEYVRYDYVFEDIPALLLPTYQTIIQSLSQSDTTSLQGISEAIRFLSKRLEKYYHKKVMLFIDEFDTPFIEAHVGDFYEELHGNLSLLLSSALKNNNSLQYAMLTGIQRVAKENIFSGLNNPKVCTVADQEYAQYFGFTEEETKKFLAYYGLDLTDEVKDMYDGYRIGNQDIYNPWSIINYADTKELNAYWVNTSANKMIRKAMERCDSTFKDGYDTLIREGTIETTVLMETSFFEQSQTSSLWGLFVNAGYLTIEKKVDIYNSEYRLRIPNSEVLKEFSSLTAYYLDVPETTLTDMNKAIKIKDKELFLKKYQEMLLSHLSYYDVKGENSYHTFLLGMCISLRRDYCVKSNQEAGKGRADIILQAKKGNLPSYIIELKYTGDDHQDLKELAYEAVQQIEEKQYGHDIKGSLIFIGLAHHNKEVEMCWKE